jgi:signal transduction histidine kinase
MRSPLVILLVACLIFGIQTRPAAAQTAQPAAFAKAIERGKVEMLANPSAALKQADFALGTAAGFSGREQQIARATALWLKIEANIGLNRLDMARSILPEAINLATSASPESKLHGDLIRSQGAIAALGGKSAEALRSYLEAHRIFQKAGEKRAQAMTLQDIGLIYWDAGDYERMLSYYDDAQEIYNKDPGVSLGANNNRGEAYRLMRRWTEAEKAYLAALANARELKSTVLQTRILTNLALVQVAAGKLPQAISSANLAAKLGATDEARDWLHYTYGAKATIAIAQGNDGQAEGHIDKLFAGIDLTKTDLSYLDFHKLAADLYSRIGKPDLALRHLQAYQRLDSEARNIITSTSSQLLEARFSSANQKTRIAELKQGQLQRDVEIARQRGTIATGLLLAAFAIIVVVGLAFLSVRKSRNEVRGANDVLTDVNAKLETALKAKTDFLAMTSHEIRTPLNGIMGMTQVILADGRLDQDTRERVNLVLGAGQTMQSLVDDLLDVAKMEGGEISIRKDFCDLRALLVDSASLWAADAQTKGVSLDLDVSGIPHLAYTDGARVRQVVFNLLANAIKFTPQGSVWLSCAMHDEQTVEIQVRDSGIGIPDDELERVFEPFHQVDNAMSRGFGGAGLGLAICRNIIASLGGKIGVTSTLGEGSTFRITLPIGREPGTDDLAQPAHEVPAARTTLVVDSNELRQAKVKAVLEPHFETVHGAQTLEEASRVLQVERVGVLIIDATGLLDGEAHCADLRVAVARAKEQGASTILLLPAEYGIKRAEALELGSAILLQKPLKPSMLIEAANALLKPQTSQREAA